MPFSNQRKYKQETCLSAYLLLGINSKEKREILSLHHHTPLPSPPSLSAQIRLPHHFLALLLPSQLLVD
jgi:hypothetical protein